MYVYILCISVYKDFFEKGHTWKHVFLYDKHVTAGLRRAEVLIIIILRSLNHVNFCVTSCNYYIFFIWTDITIMI